MIAPDRPLDRAAAFVADIEAIPETLDRVDGPGTAAAVRTAVEALEVVGAAPASTRRVLLVGLGSSRFAALDAEGAFRAAGLDVEVHPASSDALPAPDAGTLCVAISNGGRSAEVVAEAARRRDRQPLLAITRDPSSPLAAAAEVVLPLPVEPEASGVAVTSFVATIALLRRLAAALAGATEPPFEADSAAAREALESRAAWLPSGLAALGRAEEVAVLAPWSARGTAEQAALLFREGPRRTATAFETAEWLHTGVYTALPGSVVLLLAGSPSDDEVERTVAMRGGTVIRAVPGVTAGAASITGPALLAAELWRAMPAGKPGDT